MFLSFKFESQIDKGVIVLDVPNEFKIAKGFECFDIVTNEALNCRVKDANTISLIFDDGPSRPYSGFSIKFGKLKHPQKASESTFALKVLSSLGLFA